MKYEATFMERLDSLLTDKVLKVVWRRVRRHLELEIREEMWEHTMPETIRSNRGWTRLARRVKREISFVPRELRR